MNVAVFLGGTSAEREVSFASGIGVINALRERGHSVIPVDPALGAEQHVSMDELLAQATHGTPPSLEKFSNLSQRSIIDCVNSPVLDTCDVVFLVLHGTGGEDGTIQALLELRGKRYTGSGVLASALATDKAMSKIMFRHIGVATPDWFLCTRSTHFDTAAAEADHLGLPLIVKPNKGGSTLGLTVVRTPDNAALRAAVDLAFQYSDTVLLERFVPGKELTVSIVAGKALPIIEICPKGGGIYDYEHKYTKGMTEYFCPADLDPSLATHIRHQAERIFQSFECRGFARIDFRLDADSLPWCLEVNTIPGMTGTSLVPKAAAAAGISYAELCDMVLTDAASAPRGNGSGEKR